MAWKMIGEPKTRKLTKTLAEEFCNMTPAPHDRPLNATRAAVLRSAFEHHKFRTCEWASAFCRQTKQTYRINGKHTSTVLSQMNGTFPKGVSVITEHYECDTLEDVAALYSTFDTRASVRSTGDINLIFAAACPELEGVDRIAVNLGVTGMSFELWEDQYSHQAPESRAQLCIANSMFIKFVDDLLQGQTKVSKHLRRGPVVAAIFRTWKKSHSAAAEFWSAVRDGTGAKPSDPDRRLRDYLLTTAVYHGTGATGPHKAASRREVYVKCLHAWNAWRAGGTTDLKFYPNAKTPSAQ